MIIIIIIIILLILITFFEKEEFDFKSKYENINEKSFNLNHSKFIYCKIDGKLTNSIKLKDSESDYEILENIDTGYYNYKDNYIALLKNNMIYKINLFTDKLEKEESVENYFTGLKDTKINCLFYFLGDVYIFIKEKVVIYSLKQHKILEIKDADLVFEDLPTSIDYCFINYNDLLPNDPIPYIYAIKNKTYYKYTYDNKIFRIKDTGIFDFNMVPKSKIIKNNRIFKVKNQGVYRIICVGAGLEGGGYGGLVFNDYMLNKNDKLKIVVGSEGNRIPVKDSLQDNKLNYTGSCSGAGATSVFKNKQPLVVGGGGGGWVSEIIKCPKICNSLPFFSDKVLKSKIVFPIKKIQILSEKGKDARYKIGIINFNIKTLDDKLVDLKINCEPEYDSLNLKPREYMFETQYSNFNEKAMIEIDFNQTIVDYYINLDFEILVTDKLQSQINNTLIIFDEQNRRYVLSNFNSNFKKMYGSISSDNLLSYLSLNNLPKITTNNKYVNDGNRKHKSVSHNKKTIILKNKSKDINSIDYKDIDFDDIDVDMIGDETDFNLNNGGFSTTYIYNNINCCGGGGGIIGGKGISLPLNFNYSSVKFPYEYVAGSGGKSYINNLKFNDRNLVEDQFINNYNQEDGYCIITKIN